MDISDYLNAKTHRSTMPSIRKEFHELLKKNICEFARSNATTLGNADFSYFKSTREVAEVVELNDIKYIIYNELCGDFSQIIHYLAREDYEAFLVSHVLEIISLLLQDEVPLPVFFGSRFAERATSLTEMFITYHEIGHITYSTNKFPSSKVDVLQELAMKHSGEIFKERFSLVRGEASLTVDEIIDEMVEKFSRFEKLISSDELREEVFCDIYSSEIVTKSYGNLGRAQNLALCGVALIVYSIISDLYRLAAELNGEISYDREREVSMFRIRSKLFYFYMVLYRQSEEVEEFRELARPYKAIESALDVAHSLLVPAAGDPVRVNELIGSYRK
jgi:hypothetical protein